MRVDVRPYSSPRALNRTRAVERSRFALICASSIGDLLLSSGNGIGAGNEAPRRRRLTSNRDQRSRELREVAGLPAVLGRAA